MAAEPRSPGRRRRATTAPSSAPSAALRDLDAEGAAISFQAVARRAGVSRQWLYTQPELRAEIERAARPARRRADGIPARQRAREASLRQRIATLRAENRGCARRTPNSRPNWRSPTANSATRTDTPATDTMTRADPTGADGPDSASPPQKQQRHPGVVERIAAAPHGLRSTRPTGRRSVQAPLPSGEGSSLPIPRGAYVSLRDAVRSAGIVVETLRSRAAFGPRHTPRAAVAWPLAVCTVSS